MRFFLEPEQSAEEDSFAATVSLDEMADELQGIAADEQASRQPPLLEA